MNIGSSTRKGKHTPNNNNSASMSAGEMEMEPWYYDTFATVFLPDTVHSRIPPNEDLYRTCTTGKIHHWSGPMISGETLLKEIYINTFFKGR